MGTTSPHHHHHHHHHHQHPLLTKKLITRVLYCLLPLALLHLYLYPLSFTQPNLTTPSHKPKETISNPIVIASSQGAAAGGSADERRSHTRNPPCDYSDGRWVPDPSGSRYNGTTCSTIKDGQNCIAHGRPDTGYLHWRWQPNSCALPPFDPISFLLLIQNKHLSFIGDSMARNQLESLLCLLSAASPPELLYTDGPDNKFRRWVFRSYNATVSVFWSPFLVKGIEKSESSGLDHNKLFLDSPDDRWSSEIDTMDIIVFSAGHWFLHPAVYHDGGDVIGCHHCPGRNHTEIGFFEVFGKAFRTALREVVRRSSPEKEVVVTTFSPAHFEGEWDRVGACARERPYGEGEKEMEYMDKEMRRVEVEEVAAAAVDGGGGRVQALDVTRMAMMRPDGHPGPYMNPDPFKDGPKDRVQNDCVHWCLPGPIDMWNEILLEMLKRG